MRVYIVNAFSAEPYDDSEWVHKAFFKKEDAKRYVKSHTGVYDENTEDFYHGWMVSSIVTEIDVE